MILVDTEGRLLKQQLTSLERLTNEMKHRLSCRKLPIKIQFLYTEYMYTDETNVNAWPLQCYAE